MYIQPRDYKQAAESAAFFIGPWPTVLGTVLYLDQQGLQALIPSTLCLLALSVFSLTLIFSLMVVAGVGGPACYLLSTYRG